MKKALMVGDDTALLSLAVAMRRTEMATGLVSRPCDAVRSVAAASSLAAAVTWLGWPVPAPREKPAMRMFKCGLPGCETMTAHHGGYCCSEHCRKHREAAK